MQFLLRLVIRINKFIDSAKFKSYLFFKKIKYKITSYRINYFKVYSGRRFKDYNGNIVKCKCGKDAHFGFIDRFVAFGNCTQCYESICKIK